MIVSELGSCRLDSTATPKNFLKNKSMFTFIVFSLVSIAVVSAQTKCPEGEQAGNLV
jgi:hypothetical protein